MGAGDLNMKKSWHPLLHSNQEKVWLQEQEAAAERKKLEELRKEREHERQMQELQRIHEEAGGKKRVERVEWMYNTPAAKSGPSEGELEDYLLGKKRVDKLLQGNEAEQLSRTADIGAKDAPSANTQRDMAAKIREDPLLAIKQQEQAVYEMLMKDPTRLRQMRAKMGLEPERKERKHRHRHRDQDERREDRHRHRDERRSDYDRRDRDYDRRHDDHHRHRRRDDRERYDRRDDRERYDRGDDRSERYERRDDRTPRRTPRDDRDGYRSRPDDSYDRAARRDRTYTPRDTPRHTHDARPSRPRSRSPQRPRSDADREAKLAAMMSDAKKMDDERSARIQKITAEERSTQAEEDQRRNDAYDHSKWREGGGTGKAAFLVDQQRSLWGEQSGGMDLHERLRRSRHGLERIAPDE